jgi:tetratricopeptide (TPR) repeat protein
LRWRLRRFFFEATIGSATIVAKSENTAKEPNVYKQQVEVKMSTEDPRVIADNLPIQPAGLTTLDEPGFALARDTFARAFELQKQSRLQEAIASYNEATSHCAAMYEAYFNAGMCYEKLEDTDNAIELFEKAAVANRFYPAIYRHLAELYAKKGNEAKSKANWALYNQL